MAEYIEREAAIKSAAGALHGVSQIVAVDVVEALENEPTADVVEVKHGHWISGYDTVCSVCKIDVDVYNVERFNYCPNCGADMRGGMNE